MLGIIAPSRSRPDARSWSSSTRFGTSSKKACKLWIWKAFERRRRLIDWQCSDRDQGTLERLLARLEP
jgi:IS1 family transposase